MNVRKKNPAGILLTVMLLAALLTICLELGLSYLRPDTPSSIPKHLIHFAIMFVLLGGAVLLCLFCPPFKKLWAWIDEHILTQETRPIAIDIIYAVIAGLLLLHHFYVILYYPIIPTGASKLAPFWIIMAILTILMSKSWQKIPFFLSAIYLLFTFERLYSDDFYYISESLVYFFSAIYALFICFSVVAVLRSSLVAPFLKALCALWTLATLTISIAGLYTAWTGIPINNFTGSTTHVEDGRLWIFSYPTISASFTCCGGIIALIGLSISKHKSIKILYLCACLITMIANALTDARTSFIAFAFMASGTLCIGLWTTYRNKKQLFSKKQSFLFITALMLCFGICFYSTVECQRLLGTRFVEIRNRGITFVANAKADDMTVSSLLEEDPTSTPPEFEQRDMWLSNDTDINESLSGRIAIWQRALNFIHNRPLIWLYGRTINEAGVTRVIWDVHCHNLFIQTLLEGGIIAFSLFVAIICYGIYHSFRLWNRKGILFWQRLLPLPVFTILLWEMAECLTHFSYGHPPMTLLWFFLGATITVSKSLGKAPKSAERPAIPAENAVTKTGE